MINYTPGASYGNNFINGDEALFEDASLQRDSFGFQIRPGIQSGKNDWRTANSGIAMAQIMAKNAGVYPGYTIQYGTDQLWYWEEYETSYKSLNFTSFATTPSIEANVVISQLKTVTLGNPCAIVKEKTIEITKAGTYIIQAFAEFAFTSRTSGNSIQVCIGERKGNEFGVIAKASGKQSNFRDNLQVTYIGWAKPGKLTLGFMSDASQFYCQTSLNLYRLS